MKLFTKPLNGLSSAASLLPTSTVAQRLTEGICTYSTDIKLSDVPIISLKGNSNNRVLANNMLLGKQISARHLLASSSDGIQIPFGARSHYTWHFLSRQRVEAVNKATDILELEDIMRLEGNKYDYIAIRAFLKRVCILLQERADALGLPPSNEGLLVRFDEPERARYEALVSQVCDVVSARAKWFDPSNAAAVAYCLTRWLGRAEAPLIEQLLRRVVARLPEAKSKDVQYALDATLESAAAPHLEHLREPMLRAAGAFLGAKLPTGRVPPEVVAKITRLLVNHWDQPDEELLEAIVTDIAVRLEIYSPTALGRTLLALSKVPALTGAAFKRSRSSFLPEGVNVPSGADVAVPLADACLAHVAAHAAEHANEHDLIKFLGAISKLASPGRAATAGADAGAEATESGAAWAKRNSASLAQVWFALEQRLAPSTRGSFEGNQFPFVIKLVSAAARLQSRPPPAVTKFISSTVAKEASTGGISEFAAANFQRHFAAIGLPLPREVLDLLPRKAPVAATPAAAETQ